MLNWMAHHPLKLSKHSSSFNTPKNIVYLTPPAAQTKKSTTNVDVDECLDIDGMSQPATAGCAHA